MRLIRIIILPRISQNKDQENRGKLYSFKGNKREHFKSQNQIHKTRVFSCHKFAQKKEKKRERERMIRSILSPFCFEDVNLR